jgi:hypothetical protein
MGVGMSGGRNLSSYRLTVPVKQTLVRKVIAKTLMLGLISKAHFALSVGLGEANSALNPR